MGIPDKNNISSRKTGMENIIMMRIPADRFHSLPPYYDPPIDKRSRFQVALLAQSCNQVIFDDDNTGQSDELYLWLQLASTEENKTIQEVDLVLPTTPWLVLASATNNPSVQQHMKSFGFKPLYLEKMALQEKVGSILFPDQGRIDWNISGSGKRLHKVSVNHVLFNTDDKPDSTGHRITALLSDTVMGQYGQVRIQTTALEPFLLKGEKVAAFIHRTGNLEADIVWQVKQYYK